MARRKKGFSKVEGYYYFDVFMNNSPITIHRAEKEKAVYAFQRYRREKKRCVWHGKWTGKKFTQSDWEKLKTA